MCSGFEKLGKEGQRVKMISLEKNNTNRTGRWGQKQAFWR